MLVSPARRGRLETQGFRGLDDNTLAQVEPWLHFSPALCTVLMGLGTLFGSPLILLTVVPIAVLGAIFITHPFDLVYNYGIRYVKGTPPLPPNGVPRRFACGVAAVWLMACVWAFTAGAMLAGYILGGIITLVGIIVSTTHFCVPSTIYGFLFGKLPTLTVVILFFSLVSGLSLSQSKAQDMSCMEVNVDHVMLAVGDLQSATEAYHSLGFKINEITGIPYLKAIARSVTVGEHGGIILLQPVSEVGTVASFIQSRGEGIIGVSLEVSDLDAALDAIQPAVQEQLMQYEGVFGSSFMIPAERTFGMFVEMFFK